MILSEILFLAYLPILGGFIGAGLKHVYSNPGGSPNWVTPTAILGTCLLLAGVIGLLKWLTVICYKKFRIGLLGKCDVDRMIGYGGIMICGIVPRTLVYLMEVNNGIAFYAHYYLIVTSLITSFVFYFLFALRSQKYCHRNPKNCSTLYKVINYLNLFTLIVILVVTSQFITGPRQYVIGGYQLGYYVMCWVGIQEYLGVLGGALVLKEQEMDLESEGSKNAPKMLEKEPLRLDCKLCFVTYSTYTHIPRILKECGHTVCEKCVDILLKSHNGQHIFCPVCQKVTVVNGVASSLPMNYETLEAMEWRDAAPSAPKIEYIGTVVMEA